MTNEIKYRTYKTSINVLFIGFYTDSKMYEIKDGRSCILPGLKYSLITLLLGWWGFGLRWNALQQIRNTITALHINFSGGEDFTKGISELEYDEKTIWVYNNLPRSLFEKTDIFSIDIIIDLQADYLKSGVKLDRESNIVFLIDHLKKINIVNLKSNEIQEIITLIKQFEFRN